MCSLHLIECAYGDMQVTPYLVCLSHYIFYSVLPFSAGKWSNLTKDFHLYKNLTVEAVSLKQYAANLSSAVDQLRREVIHQHFDNSEKDALNELSNGLILIQEVLIKAARGVTVIKEQSKLLILALNLSATKTEQEKLETAMQVFSTNSKVSTPEIKEFEDGLVKAKGMLTHSEFMLRSIVQRLNQIIEDKKADKDTAQYIHIAAIALEAALGTAGALMLGSPLAPVGILFGIHGYSIMEEHSNFLEQEGEIKDRIDGYETVYTGTEAVCDRVDAKINQLQEVYAKTITTENIAVEQLSNPEAQCELLQLLAEALVKACDIFLKKE